MENLTNDTINSHVFSGRTLTLSWNYEFQNKTTVLTENGIKMESQTIAKGAANFSLSAAPSEAERNMLLRAINNRTRERNYANICLQLAEGQITEEEFENEIANNENRYVISFAEHTSPEEIKVAALLANEVLDVDTEDDFRELFSIGSASLSNLTKAIEKE